MADIDQDIQIDEDYHIEQRGQVALVNEYRQVGSSEPENGHGLSCRGAKRASRSRVHQPQQSYSVLRKVFNILTLIWAAASRSEY